MSLEISAETSFALDLVNETYVAEYQSVYNSLTTKPNASIADAQNTMVSSLVSDGVWAKLDALWMFAQTTNGASEALVNWINPGTNDASLVDAPAFVALEGFTSNGSSSYINSNFNPTTDGVNFVVNSVSLGVYSRTDANESSRDMGLLPSIFVSSRISGDLSIRANDGANSGTAVADSLGFFAAVHGASTDKRGYYNKVEHVYSVAGSSMPNEDMFILCQNDGAGAPGLWSTRQISMSFMGGVLTSGEISDFVDAIETYMDSNSRGVVA